MRGWTRSGAAVFELLPPATPEAREAVAAEGEAFEAEHMVYAPAGDGGFEVVREDHAYRVAGRGIEMLVERHDLSNLEALAYLEQRLREIGVIAALERAGFEPGRRGPDRRAGVRAAPG